MLVREGVCRVAAGMPRTHKRGISQLVQSTRWYLSARTTAYTTAIGAISRPCAIEIEARRSYAAAARPTRAVPAAKKTVRAKPATKKTVSAKPATKKTTKTVAKKKKTPARKTVKKAAKKPVAKKKKPAVVKKAISRKRVKKVLSPEAKEKAYITQLRQKALREPCTYTAISGLNAYIAKVCSGPAGEGQGGPNARISEATKTWKALTPAEHERYNQVATEMTVARRAEYSAWVRSHTPDQIRLANNARALLRRKLVGTLKKRRYPSFTSKIQDDRQTKKALSSFVNFNKARWASGDLNGIAVTEAAKLVGTEWRAMSASEKKAFEKAPAVV